MIMIAPTIFEMLKFANLQIAAEALYDFRAKKIPGQLPGDIDTSKTYRGQLQFPFWSPLTYPAAPASNSPILRCIPSSSPLICGW